MTTSPSSTPFRVPGRLISGPTDLGAAFPYGGNQIGLAQAIRLDPRDRESPSFVAEELGQQPFEGLWLGRDFLATAMLRQWTTDVLTAGGWAHAAGTGSLPSTAYPHASTKAPQRKTSRAVKLLFVPEEVAQGGSTTGDRALSWILYAAHPVVREPVGFTGFGSAFLFVAWEALVDDSGRVAHIASFGDLSL